jgi:hypothetical protein
MLAIRVNRGMESTFHALQLDAFETTVAKGSLLEVAGQNVAAPVLHPTSPCDEVASTSPLGLCPPPPLVGPVIQMLSCP